MNEIDPLVYFFIAITMLGDALFLLIVLPFAYFYRKKEGFKLALTVLIAIFFSTLLKNIFKVPRPSKENWLVYASGYSFPSGHSTNSSAFWGYLSLYNFENNKALSLISIAVFLLVGYSRVFLGVHTWSDVLAGWTLGLFFAAINFFHGDKIAAVIYRLKYGARITLYLVLYVLAVYVSLIFAVGDPLAWSSFNNAIIVLSTILGATISWEFNKRINLDWEDAEGYTKLIIAGAIAILIVFPFYAISRIIDNLIVTLVASYLIGVGLVSLSPYVLIKLGLLNRK